MDSEGTNLLLGTVAIGTFLGLLWWKGRCPVTVEKLQEFEAGGFKVVYFPNRNNPPTYDEFLASDFAHLASNPYLVMVTMRNGKFWHIDDDNNIVEAEDIQRLYCENYA